MISRPRNGYARVALLPLLLAVSAAAFGDASSPSRPGRIGGGVTLLPNGWKIAAGGMSPAGRRPAARHARIARRRCLLVATKGTRNRRFPSWISSTNTSARRWNWTMRGSGWRGTRTASGLYVSGAAKNTVHESRWADGRLTRGADIALGPPLKTPSQAAPSRPGEPTFVGGLAVSPDGTPAVRGPRAWPDGQRRRPRDTYRVRSVSSCPPSPTPASSRPTVDAVRLVVGRGEGSAFDAKTLEPVGEIAVGEHPNAMAITSDGRRLFVACANTNAVWAIDAASRRPVEQIRVSMFPDAPPGSTPNARQPFARRTAAARRQCRQQRGRRRRRRHAGCERCQGIHPDRLVSDRGDVQRRRQERLRAQREGAVVNGESAFPAADPDDAGGSRIHRRPADRNRLGPSRAVRKTLQALTKTTLR